ncbi:MAG: sensor histidine kinase [Acidimicrobiia bacterium]
MAVTAPPSLAPARQNDPRPGARRAPEALSPDRRARRRRFSSVRARATSVAVLVLGAALLVLGGSVVIAVRDTLVGQIDDAGTARALSAQIEAGTLPAVIRLPGGHDDEDEAFVQVVDSNGRIVSASANYVGRPVVATVRPDIGDKWRTTLQGLPFDPDDRFQLLGVTAMSPDGPWTVYVGTEVEKVVETLQALRRALWLGAPVLLAVTGALVWVLVGRSLRPVEAIRSRVTEISGRALHQRVPEPQTDDEIGRLARTMNDMLERLEAAAERQRRFVSDASHELRSPLAASRAELEVAVTHPHAADWPATAADLLAENERMERLITNLLYLARTDERDGPPGPAPVTVDLDDVVLAEVGRLPRRPGVAVDVSDVSGGRVRGNREHLSRVVRNVLENAVRHAGSRVAVELGGDGGEVVLTVSDDGPGVPGDDRARIFDRFVRLDDARSRDSGGAGLGLAIVASMVAAHRGRIWVEDAPATPSGARFVVRLPAA